MLARRAGGERPSGYVSVTLSFEQEGGVWVGTCLELGTSTFADTLGDCREELEGLVVEHLNALEENGTRERFFKEWNIPIHTDQAPQEYTVTGSWPSGREMPMAGPLLQPHVFPTYSLTSAQELVEA